MNAPYKMSLRHVLLAATILSSPLIAAPVSNSAAAQVSVSISVPIAPPELPVYDQPPIPEVGYVWTPGYWAWDQADGYYWVPGTWVLPPRAMVYWTPPYWGWSNGVYLFHAGYWGPQVGYYGGVDYGYGYGGRGYEGGRWQGGHFAYNRAVNNFGSVHVTNVYEQNVTVVNNSRVSYQGGSGGLKTEPTAQERRAEQEHHIAMTAAQTSLVVAAAKRPDLAAKRNDGHPGVVAMSRPGQFEGPGVVHGQAANANAQPDRPGQPAQTPGQAQAEHGSANPADHGVPPGQREANRPGQPAPGNLTPRVPMSTPRRHRPAMIRTRQPTVLVQATRIRTITPPRRAASRMRLRRLANTRLAFPRCTRSLEPPITPPRRAASRMNLRSLANTRLAFPRCTRSLEPPIMPPRRPPPMRSLAPRTARARHRRCTRRLAPPNTRPLPHPCMRSLAPPSMPPLRPSSTRRLPPSMRLLHRCNTRLHPRPSMPPLRLLPPLTPWLRRRRIRLRRPLILRRRKRGKSRINLASILVCIVPGSPSWWARIDFSRSG